MMIKPLLHKLKESTNFDIPWDPRTLLHTPQRAHHFYAITGGLYWHQGFEFCLKTYFHNLKATLSLSININIDGLPITKSGKDAFWPILFNIHDMLDFKPMIIGVYYGKTKPKKIEEFLALFVNEMVPILNGGIIVNGHKININLRCFIWDSPARAFIKGNRNQNI